MLGGVNKDDKEADEGNVFVRPFANEYEDYSGDGIEDDEDGVESEVRPVEEYDDEDYYQSGGIGGRKIGDDVLHGHAKAINESKGDAGNRITQQHTAGNDIVFEETHKQEEHQEWSRESNNVEVEDEENRGKARKDPDQSEEAAIQLKSVRRSNEEGESEDTPEEVPGWSSEIFGGTAILIVMLLLLFSTFLLCKWR